MNRKIDKLLLTFIIAGCLFMTLNSFWMLLEIELLGGVKNNIIDNIIAVPIFISFWFNAKGILNHIESKYKNKSNS